MLNDEEWGKWSNVQIATQCGVSDELVRQMRAPLTSNIGSEDKTRTYTTKHGTTAVMNTANIGKSKPEPQEPDDVEDVEPEPMPEKTKYGGISPNACKPTRKPKPYDDQIAFNLALDPAIAAGGLRRQMGEEYCQQLVTELQKILGGVQ